MRTNSIVAYSWRSVSRIAVIILGQLILRYLCFACFFALAYDAYTQNYSINWYNVAAGGGTSTGGNYLVSGNAGQPDAGATMTNGPYSIMGGFWAVYAVRASGAPSLKIAYANNEAIVSWPVSATGWILQTNSNLGTTNWVAFGGIITNKRATILNPTGSLFFRLVYP